MGRKYHHKNVRPCRFELCFQVLPVKSVEARFCENDRFFCAREVLDFFSGPADQSPVNDDIIGICT